MRIIQILLATAFFWSLIACRPEDLQTNRVVTPVSSTQSGGSSSQVVKEPKDCRTIYFIGSTMFVSSMEGLFKSSDMGKNWTKIEGQGLLNTAIGYVSLKAGVLFAAPIDGGLYCSLDTGATWAIALDRNYTIPYESSQSIVEFGDSNADTLFASVKETIGNAQSSHIMFSSNNGKPQSWAKVYSIPNPEYEVFRDLSVVGNSIFVFASRGGVYEANQIGAVDQWKSLPYIPNIRYINYSLVYNRSEILVCCNDGIRSTVDYCKSWSIISSGLPPQEAGATATNGKDVFTAMHNENGGFLGIYRRVNNRGFWMPLPSEIQSGSATSDNASYVQTMYATGTHLIIGTHGFGIKIIELK